MIEGGTPGASALAQAAQRRAEVDRLVAEAQQFETAASDERIMAAQLATLPPAYVILHDLQVPDLATTVDHLVVGQGGAFLVVTRRCPDAIAFHGGELWSGEHSLRRDLDGARIASALLTRALSTPVVPLIAFVGTVVPNATPPVVQGVLVCSADYVVRVITRASHTMLAPAQFTDVVQRALPMLSVPTSMQRHDPAVYHAAADAARAAALAVVATPTDTAPRDVPPVALSAPSPPAVVPSVPEPEPEPVPTDIEPAAVAGDDSPPPRRRHWWNRIGLGVAAAVTLVLALVVVGVLAKTVWNGSASGADHTPATSVGPTTTSPYVTGPSRPTLGDQVVAPEVSFVATCPAKGVGWTLTPNWPGDIDHLAEYVVEVRDLKGPWHRLGSFTTRDELAHGALVHQKPGTASGVRITAVMSDGSRSPKAPAIVAAPKSAC
jgi:hypothetical protein